MKKILVRVMVFLLGIQQVTFAGLEDIDLTSFNADMEKVYNTYPVLTTYCGEFEPLDTLGDSENVNDVAEDVLDDTMCGKYASTAKQTLNRVQKEIEGVSPGMLKKLQSEVEDGAIASEEDVIEFMFGYLQEFAEKKITRTKKQRDTLLKKNKLTERRDVQTALTIFTWEAVNSMRYEVEQYALENFDEFMKEFAEDSVDTRPIEEPTAPKPSKINPPVKDDKPWKDSGKKAMTWSVLKNDGAGVVLVGDDEKGDPYVGDTSVEESLPLLCIKKTSEFATVPSTISIDFYNGWGGGTVALSKSYKGKSITSRQVANKLCVSDLGDGYEFAQFHHNLGGISGGWHWYAYGDLPVGGTRFWVGIRDQAANPWGAGW